MDNYIGKTCPFCKTEIKEGDEVTVCPACAIPHHKGCWEENNGCTTFGCSEQRSAAPAPGVCSRCGIALTPDQAFCPACGAANAASQPQIQPRPTACPHCGTALTPDQAFCPSCGQKLDVAVDPNFNSAINQFNANVIVENEKAKKKPMKIVGIVAGIVAAVILLVAVVPNLIVTPEKLMAKGDYIAAYEKADSDEKDEVEAANAVAFCSNLCVESLKDSSSFDLRDAWYSNGTKAVVMKVSANNSYGNPVINYWYYYWDDDDSEYSLMTSVASLEDDTIYSWDDTSERMEKTLDNLARSVMKIIMIDTNAVSDEAVDNINYLFENDILDNVDLIDIPRSDD